MTNNTAGRGSVPDVVLQLSLLAIAGAAGTVARFLCSQAVHAILGAGFPYGTLVVNSVGCFLFGLLYTLSAERGLIHDAHRAVLLTGFMGAFTTFSTFAFETHSALARGELLLASLNVLAQLLLGLTAVWAGSLLAHAF